MLSIFPRSKQSLAVVGEAETNGKLSISPVAGLLASVGLLVLANGLQNSLLVLRAGHDGFPSTAISAMMSAYFGGLAVGCIVLPRVVALTGHIRAFAGLASIASAVVLLHVLSASALAWILLRILSGFAYAGIILAAESWLNAHALASTRGRLLSVYGIVTMGAAAFGQELLSLSSPQRNEMFLVVGLLTSLALVPLTLLPSRPPRIPRLTYPRRDDLAARPPLGTSGAFLSGLALGGFWGMGPSFGEQLALGISGIAAFMAAPLLGAICLQWPLGRLSDLYPRSLVICFAALAAALSAAGFLMVVGDGLPRVIVIAFLFGGFSIPLYGLCVAYANSRVDNAQRLAVASRLLLFNGAGAALGPLVAGLAMQWIGPAGLFVYSMIPLTALGLMALARAQRESAWGVMRPRGARPSSDR